MTQIAQSKKLVTPANSIAFWLGFAGLLVQLALIITIGSMTLFSGGSFSFHRMMGSYHPTGMMSSYYMGMQWYGWIDAGTWLIVGAVVLGLGVVGTSLMSSKDLGRSRNGAIFLLIAAIIAFPTMWGFGIGSLLMLVGAIIGLVDKGIGAKI